jgi:predicted TIM-barrel fold metal-dependent hydrolase
MSELEELHSDAFVYMRERRLGYPVFDADNHMYENQDALTKFVPRDHEGLFKYVEIKGRTKLAIKDHITDYIPNPTFTRVAPPGGQKADPQQRRAVPSVQAFFDPEPRLALMKDMGIDRALMWPTLASVLEERLADDPEAVQVAVRALNRWMHEHWTFNYADAIFATPIISLSILDDALKELEWVVEHGAKVFLVRVAPVPTYKGRRSFALKEFDPFWEAVQETDILVGMHSGDPGYQRYLNEWEGIPGAEFRPFAGQTSPAFTVMSSEKIVVVDAVASIIGHGLATRFPTLRFAPTEFGAEWVRPFVARMQQAYERSPVLFDEDPVEVFKRSIYVHCWHDPDPAGMAELIGVDHVIFGSDFPHPEGMADPLAYSELVERTMSKEDAAKVMGGNLATIMRVAA